MLEASLGASISPLVASMGFILMAPTLVWAVVSSPKSGIDAGGASLLAVVGMAGSNVVASLLTKVVAPVGFDIVVGRRWG